MDQSASTVVVPIDVQALVVGVNDIGNDEVYGTSHFARLRPHFEDVPYRDGQGNQQGNPTLPPIAQALLPDDFELSADADALRGGIHLHWALPDALTRGHAETGAPLIFRRAPNRWAVIRTAQHVDAAGAIAVAMSGWVLEADALHTGATDATTTVPYVPATDEDPAPFRIMGRWRTLGDQPAEVVPALTPHTALGYGTPAFAASYAMSRGVFGFWDDAATLPLLGTGETRTLCYAVLGWFDEATAAANDPVAQLAAQATSVADLEGRLNAELGWTLSSAAGAIPCRTLCLGVLSAVPGDLSATYVVPRSESAQAAVGNTTAEAAAALFAHSLTGAVAGDVERILDLVQAGQFQQLADRTTVIGSDERLHLAAFSAIQGESEWIVQRAAAAGSALRLAAASDDDGDDGDAGDDLAAMAQNPLTKLPLAAGELLDALNVAQCAYDRAVVAVERDCDQLFADWVKYVIIAHAGAQGANAPTEGDAQGYLANNADRIQALEESLQSLQAAVDHAAAVLQQGIGDAFTPVKRAGPRYYAPHDPVMALVGSAVDPHARYGGDGRYAGGLLQCRRDDTLMSALAVDGYAPIGAAQLLTGLSSDSAIPLLSALMTDAVIGDPALALWMATLLAPPQAAEIAGAIEAAQTGGTPPVGARAVTITGVLPSPVGVQRWAQPWIPLFLQWRMNFAPVFPLAAGEDYDPATITLRYTLLPDDTDLQPGNKVPMPQLGQNDDTYSGTVALSASVDLTLKRQAQKYLDQNADPNDPVVHALNGALALQLPAMAQLLQGLNQSLCQRLQILQLPINDPSGTFKQQQLAAQIAKVVKGVRTVAADPKAKAFNPLRAGLARFTALQIVDAFGQIAPVETATLIPAAALDAADVNNPATLLLPPRFAAPARLDACFRAAAADIATNAVPATTPIFGWLLYNHVDGTIAVHDGNGAAIGTFNTAGELWSGAPGGGPDATGALAQFIAGVQGVGDPLLYVRSMQHALDIASESISSPRLREDAGLALLISRPFALARLRLTLSCRGGPPLRQDWDAFTAAVQAPNKPRDDAALGGIGVPVALGDLTSGEDGIVGFFRNGKAPADFGTFYALDPAVAGAPSIVTPAPETLTTSIDAPVEIVVLFDPHCVLTATTGILPVLKQQLPPEHYAPALRQIAATFLATPLVRSGAPLLIPHPVIQGYDWDWLSPHAGAWTSEAAIDQPQTSKLVDSTIRLEEGWLRLRMKI